MWMDGSTIFHHPFASRAEAVAFIQAFLAGRFDAHEGGLEGSLCQFAKRRKVDHKLKPSRIGMVALMKEIMGGFCDEAVATGCAEVLPHFLRMASIANPSDAGLHTLPMR